MSKQKIDPIYVDYAASTPTSAAVLAEMAPFWQETFANAQSTHTPGRSAAQAVSVARESIANLLSVKASELVFTSGATEANSLAVLGAARAFKKRVGVDSPHVLVSAESHASVSRLETSFSAELTTLDIPVDETARVQAEAISRLLDEQAAILSLSHVNSEVGTIQPVREITQAVRKFRGSGTYPLVHLDASQSMLEAELTPEALGVDLLTLNPAKCFGPKGVGVLWVRAGTPLAPLLAADTALVVGDYQKIRPGTPPTPLIVGAAKALEDAHKNQPDWQSTISDLRDFFVKEVAEQFPGSVINGHERHRAVHIISVTFPEVDHDFLAAQLDARGVAVSTTSACQASRGEGSGVLADLPTGRNEAIRFSLSQHITRGELADTLAILRDLLPGA